ncbi:alpha/beta hydrolase family esterase [Caenispirillum salinarum]|uniref:extracellular catalytic domain type 1 short-chain-length polyhydroxyalkanoate depolymerase n=1 Tax=Caenispirillum salinarum TaxID=859058 RepID=UPI003850AAB0
MTETLTKGMAEATRLTRAGKLSDATALIQRLLNGETASASAPPRGPSAPVIDADYITVDAPRPRTEQAPPKAERTRPSPGAGLGATLRRLAEEARRNGGPSGLGKTARTVTEPLPDGASFETFTYANAAGSRDYKLYVPANRPATPLPLIVMLHGCTQSSDDFAAGTRMNALAEEHGCLVAYPEQPAAANANRCWNWFNPKDQQRDGGEPSILAGLTRQILRDHPADPARVYVAGLSAGGAAAAVLAAAYPDVFAAAGVHSGLPVGSARDIPSAFAAMRQGGGSSPRTPLRIPTIVFHGDADTTVNPSNGDAVAVQARSSAAGTRATTHRGETAGGHSHSRVVHTAPSGEAVCEHWTIHGAGHAWAGGSTAGSYTDPRGPDASREMLRFFFEHGRAPRAAGRRDTA